MKLLIVFATLVALVAAGGSGDVDAELLARVAQILESSGGGGGGGGGFSGGSSGAYSAPSSGYGAPGRSSGGSSGGVQLGSPERAQQVADFELGGGSNGGRSSLSSSYGAPAAPSNEYGTPSGGFGGGALPARSSGGFGGVQLGSPEKAQRLAEFELSGGSSGGSRGGNFRNGGYS